jgi:hypothetical protein
MMMWFSCLSVLTALAGSGITGSLTDPQGLPVSGATVRLVRHADSSRRDVKTDEQGHFTFGAVDPGEYKLIAEFSGFPTIDRTIVVSTDGTKLENLQFSQVASQTESVTVSADVSDAGLYAPDPAQRLMVREETLDANPGRPGMPISIPGLPVESPAGGVKPPQYFVPGVAGDHGEPIAMFFQVGGFLFQNNLPANAHGNGYADPNVIIPIAIETVETDGGAFNVREGNNSVNAAMVFGIRDRVRSTARLTADYRDLNFVGAWSPKNPANKTWLGVEVSYGNGFLKRLEHRKQYKGNVSKVIDWDNHELTMYGMGYYGFAFQPGLIPISTIVPNDTIDPRQQEQTANGAIIVNDIWRLTDRRQLQFSGFYRRYYLDVRPNFGDGLIRQSEHRNVNSEDVVYSENYSRAFSLLAGTNVRREAPRDLDLDKADSSGVFLPLTSNNLTINFYSPFVATDGYVTKFFHYDIGYRGDEVSLDNQDLLRPSFSFTRSAYISSPKGTITVLPPESARFLPTVSLSYGQAFHINDPRIGTTAIMGGTIVSKARAYQLVASKTIAKTEFRVVLAHVTTAQQLARISNDTGLQQDQGPGIIKSIIITGRRNFSHGFMQGSFARADARDRLTGEPTLEAPRLIWDVLATVDKLPFHLVARGEYEDVGRKPLGPDDAGNPLDSVPVREFRGAVVRPFEKRGFDLGLNFLIASGYGGQTLESLPIGNNQPTTVVTGFPLKSYVTGSFTYYFRRKH